MFTSFIEDTLSEKRSKEAGQEDGEKPRKNVASGETSAPNVSSREARGLTWGTPGHQHWLRPGRKDCHTAWAPTDHVTLSRTLRSPQ